MKLAVIGATDLGWKTVRRRWERCLPSAFEDVRFFHPETFEPKSRAFGSRSLRQLLNTRAAASAAIREGYRNLLVSTNTEATLLPQPTGIRYFVYADASHSQARRIYSGKPPNGRMRFRIRRLRWFFAGGHALLAMSTWAANGCRTEYGLQPDQVHLLLPPVDTELFCPGQVVDGPLKVIFLGGDFVRKGGPLLLEVAKSMPQCSFSFITRYGGKSADNVEFLNGLEPETPDLIKAIRSGHLLALPTAADCSPLAAIEAQACGLPVIIGDVGGTSEIVEDGVTGTLLRHLDAKNLASAISAYDTDRALLRRHGTEGHKAVSQNNALEVHAAKLLDIVKGLGS